MLKSPWAIHTDEGGRRNLRFPNYGPRSSPWYLCWLSPKHLLLLPSEGRGWSPWRQSCEPWASCMYDGGQAGDTEDGKEAAARRLRILIVSAWNCYCPSPPNSHLWRSGPHKAHLRCSSFPSCPRCSDSIQTKRQDLSFPTGPWATLEWRWQMPGAISPEWASCWCRTCPGWGLGLTCPCPCQGQQDHKGVCGLQWAVTGPWVEKALAFLMCQIQERPAVLKPQIQPRQREAETSRCPEWELHPLGALIPHVWQHLVERCAWVAEGKTPF